MRRQVTTTGEAVESFLTGPPPLPREAWKRIRGWHQEAVDHDPPLARVTLERITAERKELYRTVPPQGDTIPISVPPSSIDDSIPTEEEVEWAVMRLRGHRLGGSSQMRTEYLREFLREHRSEEAAKEKAKEAKAEAEAEAEVEVEGETSGSEER